MKPFLLAAALTLCAPFALANDFEPAMRSYIESEVIGWVADPTLVAAIRDQNSRNTALTESDVTALDRRWRSEFDAAARPTIDAVLGNPASEFLRARKTASAGVISEVFVMDAHGLNVAASDATSDYWQGDEEKFTETYGHPAGTMHIGEVEFDESSQNYLGQVSLPIIDPESGQPIGAITVGLNAEMLF